MKFMQYELISVSGQSHENHAFSYEQTFNYNSPTTKHFVSNDIREDNETLNESTFDEELSTSVATRSTFLNLYSEQYV